mmetsp:Transcript_79397/g.233272  ORF Transcript_79397/g.233272 Transcript_79397/m.233272 type:complete len:418 (-) Transcript_79397:11-1264(-)
MDYFAVGGRPLLSRFPPYIHGSFRPSLRDPSLEADGGLAGRQAEPPPRENLVIGGASSSAPEVQRGPAASDAATVASSDADRALPGQVVKTPTALHTGFDPKDVRPWDPCRFQKIRKLQDATRNRGQVHLMRDVTEDRLVAVKQMPNRWIRSCHSDFVIEHPAETELPWQDVGCIQFLNSLEYPYACSLLGVYRDDMNTYVVTTFATEGDLFSWCDVGVAPGLEREAVVLPLARQMIEGMQQVHDLSIVHRDLSLENILLSKLEDGSLVIRIIDFSMASTARRFRHCVRGKESYQAPELHTDNEYDAYLTDAFSLGVTLYAVLFKDYPWLSTRPGGCKCFEYVRKHGLRSYLAKRKLRSSSARIADVMSEPLKQLLEGMLALDPAERLTLGEKAWGEDSGRRSVWDERWMHDGPGTV